MGFFGGTGAGQPCLPDCAKLAGTVHPSSIGPAAEFYREWTPNLASRAHILLEGEADARARGASTVTDGGDRAELRMVQLLTRHHLMIQGHAYAILRDFHLVEDAYQEIAMVVVSNWERVPQNEQLVPWLREVTRRKALEVRRKQRRLPPSLSHEVLEQVGAHFGRSAEDSPRKRDLREVIAGCVAKLQAVARKVIRARYAEDLTCDHIAKRIGRSVQAVYGILKRARLALARCVDLAQATNSEV